MSTQYRLDYRRKPKAFDQSRREQTAWCAEADERAGADDVEVAYVVEVELA
jgi:hypothetical protein